MNFIVLINLIRHEKYIRLSFLGISLFVFVFGLLYSVVAGFVIFFGYLMGYFLCICLLNYHQESVQYLRELIDLFIQNGKTTTLKNSCSICDDLSCRRHLALKIKLSKPTIYAPQDLNDSVEQLYRNIVKNFIMEWYEGISSEDREFIEQIQYCLRHASVVLINRFLTTDKASIVCKKMLPLITKHLHDYLFMQDVSLVNNRAFVDIVVEHYGYNRLHVATLNRSSELNYLRQAANAILPAICPDGYCRSHNFKVLLRELLAGWVLLPLMDLLSDPYMINSVILLIGSQSKLESVSRMIDKPEVLFLESFVQHESKRRSSFHLSLFTIKRHTESLYAFMQFLKHRGQVHLLHFCLDVDEFNDKLLTPELPMKHLEDLHIKAKSIYDEYLDSNSVTFIGCSEALSQAFKYIVNIGICGISKLKTSNALYEAYDFVYNELDSVWVPAFFHSSEFYQTICGSRELACLERDMNKKNNKHGDYHTAVSKLNFSLVKTKSTVKSAHTSGRDDTFYSSISVIEDGAIIHDINSNEDSIMYRDLSAWNVSLVSCQITNKAVNFCINVHRMDIDSEHGKTHWVVFRRDQDFLTLRSKLIEFHGEGICNSPLPFRRVHANTSTMADYEKFLKAALQNSALRCSDLLYTFLTAEEDFTVLISTVSASNNQDLGTIYASMANKLRKEKGQHLDNFLRLFMSSIKSKNKCDTVGGLGCTNSSDVNFDTAEVAMEMTNSVNDSEIGLHGPATFRSNVFKNNFDIITCETVHFDFHPQFASAQLSTPIECIFYLLKVVFLTPNWLLRLYTAVCNVFSESFEMLLHYFIKRNLNAALKPSNLTIVVRLLTDTLFNEERKSTRIDEDTRRLEAIKMLEKGYGYSPILNRVMGANLRCGSLTLLKVLQDPHYNKQLFYTLLDIVLLELFPELSGGEIRTSL